MRGRLFVAVLFLVIPTLAYGQVPAPKSKQDSIARARADSVARADSIALVKQLEKELGAQGAADTSASAAAQQGPYSIRIPARAKLCFKANCSA